MERQKEGNEDMNFQCREGEKHVFCATKKKKRLQQSKKLSCEAVTFFLHFLCEGPSPMSHSHTHTIHLLSIDPRGDPSTMQLLAQQSPSARNVRAVRRAFLNVETMRHLRLAAGDHVLVKGSGDSTAEGATSPVCRPRPYVNQKKTNRQNNTGVHLKFG